MSVELYFYIIQIFTLRYSKQFLLDQYGQDIEMFPAAQKSTGIQSVEAAYGYIGAGNEKTKTHPCTRTRHLFTEAKSGHETVLEITI